MNYRRNSRLPDTQQRSETGLQTILRDLYALCRSAKTAATRRRIMDLLRSQNDPKRAASGLASVVITPASLRHVCFSQHPSFQTMIVLRQVWLDLRFSQRDCKLSPPSTVTWKLKKVLNEWLHPSHAHFRWVTRCLIRPHSSFLCVTSPRFAKANSTKWCCQS